MGASDRDRADVPLPRPVWIDSTGMWNHNGGRPPSIGILLEWRRAADIRGQPAWEGLVIWANSFSERGWSSGTTWMRSQCIRPMVVADWKVDTGREARARK